jgi:hypothetical protein
MKYVYVAQNKVQEIIPEFKEPFFDIPASKRYPVDFLNQCFILPDDFDVQLSYDYVQATKEFRPPVQEEEPEEIKIPVGDTTTIDLGFMLSENFSVDSNLMFSVEGSTMTITPKDAGAHTIRLILNQNDDRVIEKIILVNAKEMTK